MVSDRTTVNLGARDAEALTPTTTRRGRSTRYVLLAGVAGACVLGAGLGLWARPAMSERPLAAAPPAIAAPKAALAARELRIVVDDRPAPVGAPLDVLPADTAPHTLLAPPVIPRILTRQIAQLAPGRPAARAALIPVALASTSPPEPAPAKPPPITPAKAKPVARAAATVAAIPAIKPPPMKAKLAPVRLAKAEVAATPSRKAELAHAAAAKAEARRIEVAKAADAVKSVRAEKLAKLRLAKIERRRQMELAKAEARGRAEALTEARTQAFAEAREDERKRRRLASFVRAVRHVLPREARTHGAPPVEVAKLDHKHPQKAHREPKIERAALKTHKSPHLVATPVRPRAVQLAPPQHASGLMKVSTPRCANRDPGEAAVCADPGLGAADRQLTRAYQSARAAGVPEAQLRQQQQRWLSARSSAAREAPWAVHDVYLARIAELNGQAREARPAN